MSRRKQAKPIRHLEDGTPISTNGEDGGLSSGIGLVLEHGGDEINTTGDLGSSDLERSADSLGGDDPHRNNGITDSDDSIHLRVGSKSESRGEEPERLNNGGNTPSLFIKRSLDEDFANNNNTRRNARRRRRGSNEDDEEEEEEEDTLGEDMDTATPLRDRHDLDESDTEYRKKMDLSGLFHMNNSLGGKIPGLLPFSNTSTPLSEGGYSTSSVTEHLKEQLHTISMTISQLSANMTNSSSSPKNVQELAVLQATLFSLQQQQLLQMQILSQIQQQQKHSEFSEHSSTPSPTSATPPTPRSSIPSIAELARKMERQHSIDQDPRLKESLLASSTPLPPSMPPKSNLLTGNGVLPPVSQSTSLASLAGRSKSKDTSAPSDRERRERHHNPPGRELSSQILDPNAPPPSLASSIIMHGDNPEDDKPVNSLELLQKRAQGILNNASQGLLANNLADFSVSRDKDFDKKEPFFKHRCRYCGKVFGSDSALQIHVRSHTGERPYKCNICGNRFTTKGNLKVHFQRHSSKFPHVKMNPNLVPEHLDKFYPPLLQQLEDAEKKGQPLPNVNNPMAGMTPLIPPGMALPSLPNTLPGFPSFSPPLPLGAFSPSGGSGGGGSNGMPRFPLPTSSSMAMSMASAILPTEPLKREEVPENLTRATTRSRSVSPLPSRMDAKMVARQLHINDLKDAMALSHASFSEREASLSPRESLRTSHPDVKDEEIDDQEEPENLTKSRTRSVSPPRMEHSPSLTPDPRHSESSPGNIMPFKSSPLPMLGTPTSMIPLPNGPILIPPSMDPAKDPNVYTNLLPRPGSNDNAWESLIEVAKTSETSKLEQLVNNIEHKLSDPNECVICHRVLSCKSALQMHYRTHTGERPFKCRICGRAFTTKGNLKTHMGVHRAKPPMRMFHQCPVCHKKYANALVLQQHIKTHTGEPTELTAEQIAAAEIRDFPPMPFPHGAFPGLASVRLPGSGLFPSLPSGQFPLGPFGSESQSPDIMDKDDGASGEERENSRPSSVSSTSSSNMMKANLHVPSSIPLSLSIDSMVKFSDHRPFSLVRPFLMDKASPSGPEDLSSPGRKDVEHDNGTPEEMDEGPCSSPATLPRCSPTERNSSPKSVHPREESKTDDERDPSGDSRASGERGFGCESPKHHKLLADLRNSFPMDLTPQSTSALFAGFPHGLLPPNPIFANPLLGGNPSSALTQLTAASAAFGSSAFNPLGIPFANVPGGIMRPRGNTTCQICFKVFACNSALEIHIRSHTKERPFKCHVCDRGFSTKGNMKQHALTHKTKDGESALSLSGGSPMSDNSRSDSQDERSNDTTSGTESRSEQTLKRSPPEGSSDNMMMPLPKRSSHGSFSAAKSPTSAPSSPPPTLASSLSSSSSSGLSFSNPSSSSLLLSSTLSHPSPLGGGGGGSVNATTATTTTPTIPSSSSLTCASSSSTNKHHCQVCKKPFSSGSALQIHMRTHTGDRPFKCSVCGKAFTTKGNLKVHMGTHLWSNSNQASRRGRRMSLEMSHPPIPMTAKDSEFLHRRRPELFFPPPFLPTQFSTNGLISANSQSLQRAMLSVDYPQSHNGSHNHNPREASSPPSKEVEHQAVPASVRHSGRGNPRAEPPTESSDPLRVRSPSSLQSHTRSASPPSEENSQDCLSDPKRFSHEPWNWKLKRSFKPALEENQLEAVDPQEEKRSKIMAHAPGSPRADSLSNHYNQGDSEAEDEAASEDRGGSNSQERASSLPPATVSELRTSPPTAQEIC